MLKLSFMVLLDDDKKLECESQGVFHMLSFLDYYLQRLLLATSSHHTQQLRRWEV